MNQSMKALYYFNLKPITQKDIEHALGEVGLNKGDTVMVHSDVGTFGKLGDIKEKDEFLRCILNAFKNILGKEGTLIVPTYTYEFCKSQLFDIKKTKSASGLFTEFLMEQKEAIRSEDPIFSHVGIGKNSEKLLKDVGNECFGKDSFFDRLYKIDGKIINFGKFFDITFLHYIENNFKVNYRFNKNFSGSIIKEDGTKYDKEIIFYVRYLPEDGIDVQYHMPFLGDELEKRKLLKKLALGKEYILCSKARDCYDIGIEMLKKNEYAFLKSNPYILNFEKFPFYTGVIDSFETKEFPSTHPFKLKFNKKINLIVQKHSKETEDLLNKAYKIGSLLSTNLGQGTFGIRRADDALKHLLPLCEKHISQTSFLEIGCADGYLLHKLNLLGANVVIGCEPGPMASEGKKKFDINIIQDFYKPELFSKRFDVILSYGVLEHIKDPLEFINAQKQILEKDGKIFMAVPNCEKKLNIGDISILTNEHWNYFTKKSLKNLLIMSGLDNVETTTGINQAMIYGWGKKSDKFEKKNIINSDEEEKLFYKFCTKIKIKLLLLQKRIYDLQKKNKTLGIYGGGLNIISILDSKLKIRFFDGDTAKHGKYYPGYKNQIENPKNLLTNKVDELWIMAIDYDKEIINYLKNDLKISKETNLFSFKNFLEEI